MARSPIEIALASETKAFKQGIESGVIAPLEDAIKELRKLGDTDGADKLEVSLKDAQKATERLADETKITAARIEREYRDAYREARQASDDGTSKMKAGAQEVTQELGSNLGEAVSSIRGDMSDLGQVGQDTLGGLAATLAGAGPAGIAGAAALAAGAVGLGLVTASLQEQQEQAEKLRERLQDAYAEAARAGLNYLDTVQIISQVQDLAFDPERAEEWKKVQEDANRLGMDTKDVAAAYVGDLDKQQAVMDRIAALEQDRLDRAREYVEQHGTLSTPLTNERIELEEIGKRWTDLNGITQTTVDAQASGLRTVSRLLEDQYKNTEGVIKKTGEFGDRIYELPDGKTLYVDAETGQATEDLEAFNRINLSGKTVILDADTSAAERKIRAVQDMAKKTVTFTVEGRAGRVASWE